LENNVKGEPVVLVVNGLLDFSVLLEMENATLVLYVLLEVPVVQRMWQRPLALPVILQTLPLDAYLTKLALVLALLVLLNMLQVELRVMQTTMLVLRIHAIPWESVTWVLLLTTMMVFTVTVKKLATPPQVSSFLEFLFLAMMETPVLKILVMKQQTVAFLFLSQTQPERVEFLTLVSANLEIILVMVLVLLQW
jgi:hypothetical protein